MPRLTLLPTLLRESLGPRQFPREPEPDLVMDDPEQVAAYARAGRIDGVMSAAYLFHSARISAVIADARQVIDFGCGPATQLAQVAALNPAVSFIGVDLSREMLANARRHCRELDLTNVEFVQGDITALGQFDDHSADAIISTMALHHLPNHALLEACFGEIGRLLRPGGALYLADFGRLKSLKSVLFFAYLNRKHQPHLFSRDYERSLRAAFLVEDFRELAGRHLPAEVACFTTFGIPILVLLKTPDRGLSEPLRAQLRQMRRQLPPRYRRELDDIRLFFRLSGLKQDPFR